MIHAIDSLLSSKVKMSIPSRKKNVRDLELRPGTAALVRVDYNVPFEPGTLNISDDSRIAASVETIQYLKSRSCRVILCSHLGRPRGQRVQELSLAPAAIRLSEIIGENVPLLSDCVGPEIEAAIRRMSNGSVALLENLRFHAGEEANDSGFARQLARLADCYVNDGFGAAHRRHASTYGVAQHLPAAAGLLMEREIEALSRVTEAPESPYAVVVGGAKVMDKLPLIQNLASRADVFLIGGGMVASFLSAEQPAPDGRGVDNVDGDERALAGRILEDARRHGYEVVTPLDVVVADRFAEDSEWRVCRSDEVPAGNLILDVGPETVELYAKRLSEARTIVWNGPMGVFEWPPFANGTRGVAQAIANTKGAFTVIGGGSTSDAVSSMGLADRFSHVSTGGGATLEFLEGKDLPGIHALDDAGE